MTTDSPQVAEGARLAIALTRAWETDDLDAQRQLLRQVSADNMQVHILLSMTALLSNAVGVAAEALQANADDVWQALLQLHGEPRQDPT